MTVTRLKLKAKDVTLLRSFIAHDNHSPQKLARARILLELHQGKEAQQIKQELGHDNQTIDMVRVKYENGGVQNVLSNPPRPGQPTKFTNQDVAKLSAIVGSTPPFGYSRWTIDLISEQFNQGRTTKIGRSAIWLKLKTSINHPLK